MLGGEVRSDFTKEEYGGSCCIEMSLGAMYEMDVSPGTGVLVALVDGSGQPIPVGDRFDIPDGMVEASLSMLGTYYVYCTVWPSPVVKGKEIRCTAMVLAMLGSLVVSRNVAIVMSKEGVLPLLEGSNDDVDTLEISIHVNALAPEAGGGGMETPQKDQGSPEMRPKSASKKRGEKFVAMSPSMRKSMQEDVALQRTPDMKTKTKNDGGSQKHALVDVDLVRKALDVGGARLRGVISSVVKKRLIGMWLLCGNVIPCRFLDARLAVTVFLPAGVTLCHVGKETLVTMDASTISSGDTIHKDIGYASDAVASVFPDKGSEDNAVATSVFQAALSGYLSLQHVKDMHIGGMEFYVSRLRKWISFPLKNYDRFKEQGVVPPTGVLLHGPPGTGKTLLARWIAEDAAAKLFIINGSELMSEFLGESERCLSAIFQAAVALGPSIIFIDEIDVLGPSREHAPGMSKTANRLVATLTGALDSLYGHPVMVIGATNRQESLDESLRRPRRLDKELEIGVPNPEARFEILESLLKSVRHEVSQEDIKALSLKTHGFVGADLLSLCSEASMIALRRFVGQDSVAPVVTPKDMEMALYHTKPSALREFATEIPNVLLSDVGGNHEIKQKLKEAVEWPIKLKARLDEMGAVPPKGILLHGPPGCSKTLLVKAIAGECRLNFFSVKGPELLSKYVGESEKALSHIFERARRASPAILFFDEIDGLVGARSNHASAGVDVTERVLSQMLQEMDGIKGKDDQVVIIGATNRMDRLDKALLRPGRFDQTLKVDLPSSSDRLEILKIHLKRIPIDSSVSLEDIVARTEGCSGADIASLCQKAAMHALCRASPESVVTSITQNDFNTIIKM